MYEAILSDDGEYNIPQNFTSRTAEILQVYLKSLGIRMETIIDESDYIGEPEHLVDSVGYQVGNSMIFCTPDEMYYLNKIHQVYKMYIKEHPNDVDDVEEVWDYIIDHIPFKKKHLTDNIVKIFKENMEAFSRM
jgi:hypothetical protein